MSIKCVIFDLDGTLLDTERILISTYNEVISELGKELTPACYEHVVGRRGVSICDWIVQALGLPIIGADLYSRTQSRLASRWAAVRLLPGCERLVRHLQAHAVPLALATSSLRTSLAAKLCRHQWVKEAMQAVVCGDDVTHGKPHPEAYQSVLELMGVPPGEALALEDSPAGVESALRAGLTVVAVPSIRAPEKFAALAADFPGRLRLLHSILDFQPGDYGLPAFTDTLAGVVPVEPPIRVKGTVVRGFGRGSRDLGIRTANVDAANLAACMADTVTGIYAGWARVEPATAGRVVPMVMSVGWNPFYKNAAKSAEAWLLQDFDKDFYDEKITLCVCGYIRPEADFESLEALKRRILQDAEVAKEALRHPKLLAYQSDVVFSGSDGDTDGDPS